MNPGPELDALVAEKVMGWSVSEDGTVWRDESLKYPDRLPLLEWHPSTQIGDAWQVVEKVKETTGGALMIISRAKDALVAWAPFDAQWEETSRNPMTMRVLLSSYVEAPTVPHAICLAALKAVEQK